MTKTHSAEIIVLIIAMIIIYGIITTVVATAIMVCFIIISLYLGIVNIPRLLKGIEWLKVQLYILLEIPSN